MVSALDILCNSLVALWLLPLLPGSCSILFSAISADCICSKITIGEHVWIRCSTVVGDLVKACLYTYTYIISICILCIYYIYRRGLGHPGSILITGLCLHSFYFHQSQPFRTHQLHPLWPAIALALGRAASLAPCENSCWMNMVSSSWQRHIFPGVGCCRTDANCLERWLSRARPP